jgi:hypothetical protein
MWRPENWVTPTPKTHRMGAPTFSIITEGECVAFEAGADEMLEALRRIGTPTGLPYTAYANECKGTLVFIPDEVKK